MAEVINLEEYRPHVAADSTELSLVSKIDTRQIEAVRDHIEHTLEDISRRENLPLTVAMSAGRFAAMRMFQLQGRAETLAFLDQCITTAELCEDLVRHLDEDA